MKGFEIERKYLIAMPELSFLRDHASPSQIEQTYLLPPEPWITARVRRRGREGAWTYTHTQKIRLSDLSRVEDESEIGEAEYRALLEQADPARRVIRKTRWVLPWRGQSFEIDVYPFWTDRAIMEIEMEDEGQAVELPPQIRILREVTADLRYTNASLALHIPMEEIEKG
jgi:CYTH domain-containing protein